jgi:protein tyrosine phosphatase (PTP) superfamily phosphohydrolase (DUF442 family)
MSSFKLPGDIRYNKGLIEDPVNYIIEAGCDSWLFLVGEEFANMPGGISYSQVQQATGHAANVISDPPRELDLELARQHVEALDSLPRPTLISCRTGARASAVAYIYAGLKEGAEPDEVIAAAEKDEVAFTKFEDYKKWVRDSIEALRKESSSQD